MNDVFKNNWYTVRFVKFVHDGTPLAKTAVQFAMDGKENYLTNVLSFIKDADGKNGFDYVVDCCYVDVGKIYIMCRERYFDDKGKLVGFGDWASAEMQLRLNPHDFAIAVESEFNVDCV
jgi:hypothetical protein